MYRPAHPARVQEVADRLAAYFEADPLIITLKVIPRQGTYIAVAHEASPTVGIVFHVDEVDNGASGFRDQALLRIQAYRDGIEYTPPAPKPGLDYSDVMTATGEIGVPGEQPL